MQVTPRKAVGSKEEVKVRRVTADDTQRRAGSAGKHVPDSTVQLARVAVSTLDYVHLSRLHVRLRDTSPRVSSLH